MRDYGVVRTRFWEWAKRTELKPAARTMALYLLTCPHGNSLGCFRLPLAYVCDDVSMSDQAASDALAALDVIGFIRRDAESGWTWIVGYLDHNPVPNGNVGKAVAKMLEAVPSSAPFYRDLLNSLEAVPHFPPNLLVSLMERYRNRFDTVSRKSETQTQTQTPTHDHDQIHEQGQEGGGCGALAPSPTAEAVELFNAAAEEHGFPKVQSMNAGRVKALKGCLHAVGGLDGWQSLIAKATASDFLMGRTVRSDDHANWRFNFDFMLTPKRYTKIMEGGYDNSGSVRPSQSGLGAALAGLAD